MTHDERKATPIYTGVLKYFPKAIAAIAQCSKVGNDQHHPEKPLHWDKSKSTDNRDALVRHLLEAGTLDHDGVRHSTKVAWRALAALEVELETSGYEHDTWTLCAICEGKYNPTFYKFCPYIHKSGIPK